MAWTAIKKNKRLEGRVVKVDIDFLNDGQQDHSETYVTSQAQTGDWPAELVKRHIRDLEGLDAFAATLQEGPVTLPADTVIDAAAQAWLNDFGLATSAKSLVDIGVISASNAKYTALLARLKTNFKPEYIGLV